MDIRGATDLLHGRRWQRAHPVRDEPTAHARHDDVTVPARDGARRPVRARHRHHPRVA